MKNTIACPRCGNTEFIDLSMINLGAYKINTGFLKEVFVNRYVCTNCGLIQDWVDPSDIEQLKNRFVIIKIEDLP